MKKYRFIGLAILAVCLFAGSAYSATDMYKDTYTTEDSAGSWTFTNFGSGGGNRHAAGAAGRSGYSADRQRAQRHFPVSRGE